MAQDLEDAEWDQLADDLIEAWKRLLPPRRERTDFELIGAKEVMHVLATGAQDMTPGELAKACQVSSARIAKVLGQLEEKGWIVRTPDPDDGRRTLVSLTESGRDEIAKRHGLIAAAAKRVVQELGAEDAHELLRIMKRTEQILPGVMHDMCQEMKGGDTR